MKKFRIFIGPRNNFNVFRMKANYTQALIDYIQNAEFEDIKQESVIINNVPQSEIKEIGEEICKEILLEYTEYIKNNLFKLNEQLRESKVIVLDNLVNLYNKVEGLEREDPIKLSKMKRFIIQGLKNLPQISIEEQTNCYLYLESMINENFEFKEIFDTPLGLAKENLTYNLTVLINEQHNYNMLKYLELLSQKDFLKTVNCILENKTFDQIHELAMELNEKFKIKNDQLASYLFDFLYGQENLYQLSNLDKFISNYQEMQEFLKKCGNIFSQKQKLKLKERWQLNSYFNLRYYIIFF
jgi:hypothetical protein